MSEKNCLWCGISIVVFRMQHRGKDMTATLNARGPVRDSPDEAWMDALQLEAEQIRYVKSQGKRPSIIQPAICPPDYGVLTPEETQGEGDPEGL